MAHTRVVYASSVTVGDAFLQDGIPVEIVRIEVQNGDRVAYGAYGTHRNGLGAARYYMGAPWDYAYIL